MKRVLWVCALILGLGVVPAAAQITVTAPQGTNQVASANDFATMAFQDPWDMNQRTDLGWWLNSVDFPLHGFSGFNFANGMFSGTVAADPNVWLLESNSPNLAAVGKNGSAYPLNASAFRIFAVRMRLSEAGYFLIYSSTNTFYDSPFTPSSAVLTKSGWGIYIVDMATITSWSGVKRSMRFDPAPDNASPGSTIDIDWVRLVDNQPALTKTITWTGTGPVDIYLDNNNNGTSDPNQTLGLLASNVSGNSYALNVGALAPGTYYVAMRKSGTSGSFSYSPGSYQVNAPPTLDITSPSEEGSADDFATTHLNDPWDMNSPDDIDHTINLASGGIGTVVNAETESGTPLGNVTSYVGTSAVGEFNSGPCASFAKPVVYPLHSAGRGALHHIDPTRYRILTAEVGLPNKARDLCGGSIFRVVWHVAGNAQESYAWAVALNSRAGANVVNKINLDMAALPIDPASPSQTGWVPGFAANPGIQSFRLDPHEFANPTSFYIKRVKLAAFETANTSYTVRWTASKTGGTVRVYYDNDKDPSSKTFIGQTSAASTNGSLNWNTSALPQGAQYYVYVEFDDGTNVGVAYSKWPVVIDHNPASNSRITLSRTRMNFGVTAVTVKTPPQTLRVTTLNGSPCWTAIPDLAYIEVSPMSGCGSATLQVNLVQQQYHGQGDYSGYIRVTAQGAINSPQYVETVVRVRATSTAPSGVVDTPLDNTAVTGSIAVTGWAIDDIGVSRVTICRSPVTGEAANHPACGPNQIYLGDAVMIDDTRPDLEIASPNTPLNYRAGWGFLVLTNTLPNQGNGNFTLFMHAFDVEGNHGNLGSRLIRVQNASATEPFGTIDTPGQGETVGGSVYSNYGWVLSRVRRADPPGGGAVTVFIDGVGLGSPCCWNQRADLKAIFPNHPGINTALGVFGFDTTAYANGLHTIVWIVTDNAGISSGVGSRFFNIFNAGGSVTAASALRPVGPDLGRHIDDIGGALSHASVAMREGFNLVGSAQPVPVGLDGTRRVWATERDRVEIRMAASSRPTNDEYAGYMVVNGQLRELPTGSSFDPARGTFYWQPGLGYMGAYDLMFIRTSADGGRERIPVRVTLQERPTAVAANRTVNPWAVDFLR